MHNSKSTIYKTVTQRGSPVTPPGKLEAVPLRNRARSRSPVAQLGNMKPSRYATGQDRGCPVAQLGSMKPSRYATGQDRDQGRPIAQPGNMKPFRRTRQERGCPVAQPGNMWLSRYATGQHEAALLFKIEAILLRNRAAARLSRCTTGVQLRLYCCVTSTSLRNGAARLYVTGRQLGIYIHYWGCRRLLRQQF